MRLNGVEKSFEDFFQDFFLKILALFWGQPFLFGGDLGSACDKRTVEAIKAQIGNREAA